MSNIRKSARLRRKRRVRAKVFGTEQRPRLSVFRSLNGIYVQAIDDEKRVTLTSVSTKEISKDARNNIENAEKLGKMLADKCKKAKIEEVVFDRGGYKYHGRIKAIADAARAGGLKF